MSLAVEQDPFSKPAVAIEDVAAAAARISPYIVATPLLEAPLLSEELGFRLLLKAENLQLTGSFKVRGAFNQILQASEREKRRGVVALSSGNHAQAVAYAGRALGASVTIVLPRDAPAVKVARTRRYGAEIVFYDRESEDREAVARRVAREKSQRLIHPYDDARTIAGQGSIGIEIFTQTEARGLEPDAILMSCGGGGLAAGVALTRDLYRRPARIFTVEPSAFDDMRQSLLAGKIIASRIRVGSVCDALSAASPGATTFAILRHARAEGLTVEDRNVEAAMAVAAAHFNIVLEPGGAAALAGALAERKRFAGGVVVAVASGGNVDLDYFAAALGRGARPLPSPPPLTREREQSAPYGSGGRR
jgi:threonine dehydratase